MVMCIIEGVCVELLELIFLPTIVVCSLLLLIATCKLYVYIIIIECQQLFCMFGATRYQNNCSCLHDTTIDDIIDCTRHVYKINYHHISANTGDGQYYTCFAEICELSLSRFNIISGWWFPLKLHPLLPRPLSPKSHCNSLEGKQWPSCLGVYLMIRQIFSSVQ